eukprot:TRINITY_DN8787_c0_g1_i1.p1 TRINITY_DN8787_c0_g1~~TRINITY_DN8787_c0_g1_i1.p1  ORF type:complete len:469 (-),score=75.58 TRINITY_DN8787_c0_g1_i1:1299-2705(-)
MQRQASALIPEKPKFPFEEPRNCGTHGPLQTWGKLIARMFSTLGDAEQRAALQLAIQTVDEATEELFGEFPALTMLAPFVDPEEGARVGIGAWFETEDVPGSFPDTLQGLPVFFYLGEITSHAAIPPYWHHGLKAPQRDSGGHIGDTTCLKRSDGDVIHGTLTGRVVGVAALTALAAGQLDTITIDSLSCHHTVDKNYCCDKHSPLLYDKDHAQPCAPSTGHESSTVFSRPSRIGERVIGKVSSNSILNHDIDAAVIASSSPPPPEVEWGGVTCFYGTPIAEHAKLLPGSPPTSFRVTDTAQLIPAEELSPEAIQALCTQSQRPILFLTSGGPCLARLLPGFASVQLAGGQHLKRQSMYVRDLNVSGAVLEPGSSGALGVDISEGKYTAVLVHHGAQDGYSDVTPKQTDSTGKKTIKARPCDVAIGLGCSLAVVEQTLKVKLLTEDLLLSALKDRYYELKNQWEQSIS